MIRKMTVRLAGLKMLLMHNARLSDPLDPATKALAAVTSKRKKSDADHMEVARLEFLGSLYVGDSGDSGDIVIPAQNLHAMLGGGAKKFKDGPMVKAYVTINDDAILEYDGPSDPEALFADAQFVYRCCKKVGQSRIARTRPCFRRWALTFELLYDADGIKDAATIAQWLDMAGRIVGLGDERPMFGTFTADVLSDVPYVVGAERELTA